MGREEEIIQGSVGVGGSIYSLKNKGFVLGARWADEHPREGLWDSKKVCEWIINNAWEYIETKTVGIEEVYKDFNGENLINDLKKAMEKEERKNG